METKELAIVGKTPQEQEIIDSCIALLDSQNKLAKFDIKQKRAFVMSCMIMGLNPLLNEAYPVPYWDKDSNSYVLGIIPDYKTFLSRAERSGLLDGWHSSFDGVVVKKEIEKTGTKNNQSYKYKVSVIDKEKTTLTGKLTVYRKDWTRPFESRNFSLLAEMEDTTFWNDDPEGMLEKNMIRDVFQKVLPKDCDLRDDSKVIKVYAQEPENDNPSPTNNTIPANYEVIEDSLELAQAKTDFFEKAQQYLNTPEKEEMYKKLVANVKEPYELDNMLQSLIDMNKPKSDEEIKQEEEKQASEQKAVDETKALKEKQTILQTMLKKYVASKVFGFTSNDDAITFLDTNLKAKKVADCTDVNAICRAIIKLEHLRMKYQPEHAKNSIIQNLLVETGDAMDCSDYELLDNYVQYLQSLNPVSPK